ncbi:hypothetical protein PRK78_003212 [Emydomyces testavorans]|uniref:Zn(2)-C6 fungal-type domain-containing protein n=1 Tax=Emydomyces testavorans TaxID=2070801 RepID=A0AAF0IH94_9EURO|nr:hypothetical protein PRK78_003212 [Emydomyces testavorans]
MRSSIACSRCRRSKIKCVNAGIDTTCRACESSGRECVYPTPAIGTAGAAAAAKRDLAAMADGDERNGDWESPKRQRPRKSGHSTATATKDGHRSTAQLVLDPTILTVKVWENLFELFQLHFSTILPFLHPTTFLSQIRQFAANPTPTDVRSASGHSQSPAPRAEVSPLILLGLLTLTARFHPQLTQHHSSSSNTNPCNPLSASEFYANALRARLVGNDGADFASTDINRVQGLLMLGLHEWGMCRGKSAWIYVGMAIRLAQAMGLSFEADNDQFLRRGSIQSGLDQKEQSSDDVIEQEIRRRTFWSCFIMDRCLSGGKYRPRMVKVQDVGIQLPSDNAFAFGERVRTSRLSENAGNRRSQSFEPLRAMPIPGLRQNIGLGDDLKLRANGSVLSDPKQWSNASHRSDGAESGIDRWEVGAEECVLSRLIRIIRIWGSIAKWSCSGGRRVEQCPPWHPDSQFNRLKELLVEFQEGLPRNLQYSARNTDTHIMYKNTLAPYSLMHIIYFLSVIVLHRGYIQFLPLRAVDPQGPLDEPSFPAEKFHAPEGFWKDISREVFRASRHMIELVKTCHDRDVLMETPLVGFAIYNAAFMGVYAAHFTHMDQEGYICSKANSTDIVPGLGSQGQAEIRKAIEILGNMRPRLPMAVGWFRTIHRLHTYFVKARQDYKRTAQKSEASTSNENGRNYPTQDMAFGGSHDELRLLEKILSEMGIAEDQASDTNGVSDEAVAPHVNGTEQTNGSDTASHHVKSEPGDAADTNGDHNDTRRDTWVPVNSSSHGPSREAEKHDSTILRPIENDRWPNPPGPPAPPSYSLPSIHHHNLPPTSSAPPSFSSSGVYSSPAVTSSSSPYLPPATRLQALHPWPTVRPPPPPPPPYSQSLPALNAAAQQSFAMPPLATTQPPPQPASLQLHQHHPRLTPPRLLDGGVSRIMSPFLPPSDLGTSAPWMSSLGGDDVIVFVEGDGVEKWSAGMAAAHAGVQSGWLTTIWEGYGVAKF